ncbi:hypothetical protein [Bosea sp. Root381]|uniref:hypothetical protein n=1 Tax=Bosea sp. Root381 TaxID=1736524 RepID=UPI001AED072C|nr:hypothetical protein [Bosea sp. Root381]
MLTRSVFSCASDDVDCDITMAAPRAMETAIAFNIIKKSSNPYPRFDITRRGVLFIFARKARF